MFSSVIHKRFVFYYASVNPFILFVNWILLCFSFLIQDFSNFRMISLLFRGSFFHIFHFVFLKDTFCSIFFPSSSLADMPPSIFFTSFLIYCYISFKFSFYPYLFADIFSPFSLCLSLFAYIFSSFSFCL